MRYIRIFRGLAPRKPDPPFQPLARAQVEGHQVKYLHEKTKNPTSLGAEMYTIPLQPPYSYRTGLTPPCPPLLHSQHRQNKLPASPPASYLPFSLVQKKRTGWPEKELHGHSPNFHIHMYVSDLYIPTINLPILPQEICESILGIEKSTTDT